MGNGVLGPGRQQAEAARETDLGKVRGKQPVSCQEPETLRTCLKVQCGFVPVASVSEHLQNVIVSRHSCDFCVSQQDVHKSVMNNS